MWRHSIFRRINPAWAAFVAGLLLALPAAGADDPQQPPRGNHERGVLIRFEGPITPMLEQYLYRKLDVAKKKGADLVIIEIDSPGGYLGPSLAISERLLELDWARTVAYVPREALSGAAIAALGCDDIIMNPNARLGDAGPIFQGEDALFRHAPEKIRSDLARRVRDLAEAKGRPPALAEAMVNMDLEVFPVTNRTTGQKTFMSDADIRSAENPADWEKDPRVVHESRKAHFLEVNGKRAVELGLAQGNASNRTELKQYYGLKGDLLVLEPSGVDTLVYILKLPLVTGLILVMGLIALYIEFSSPGISVGGLVAVLCFSVFFWSSFLGGTAEWLDVILFGVGVLFIIVELFVIPGFGIAGLTGILLIIASLVMALHTSETARDLPALGTTVVVILGSIVAVTIAALMLSSRLGSVPMFNRLVLNAPNPSAAAATPAAAVRDSASPSDSPQMPDLNGVKIGDVGIADCPLRPAGKARFGNDYVDVVTDGLMVAKGARVKVLKIRGNRVVVREVESG